jgi:hypothetical protein
MRRVTCFRGSPSLSFLFGGSDGEERPDGYRSSLSSEMTIGVWFLGCFATGLWIVTDALRFREFGIVVEAERVMWAITIAFRIGTGYRSRQQRQTRPHLTYPYPRPPSIAPPYLRPVCAFAVSPHPAQFTTPFTALTQSELRDSLRPVNNRTSPTSALCINGTIPTYHFPGDHSRPDTVPNAGGPPSRPGGVLCETGQDWCELSMRMCPRAQLLIRLLQARARLERSIKGTTSIRLSYP